MTKKSITEIENPKPYDLEERTLKYAKDVRELVSKLPKTLANIEDSKQLLRSSGSVGANYIEGNEALSRKDFIMRIKIARKEARESCYWLKLLGAGNTSNYKEQIKLLINESIELTKILSVIVRISK